MSDLTAAPGNELELLHGIGSQLETSVDQRAVIEPILERLGVVLDLDVAAVTILDAGNNEAAIDAAWGLSEKQQRQGRYRPGEGVTGQVIARGESVIVERCDDSPEFLDRTKSTDADDDDDRSFICVPVRLEGRVIGTLGVVLKSLPRAELQHRERLLATIASMLAQAIGLRQMAQHERQKLVEENRRLQDALEQRFRPANIIGSSNAMQPVYDMIGRVSGSDASVLILGESGVGKELIAHAIHFNSLRARGPFVKVNCAALPQSVLESELFGHEQGAFTGATRQRKGRFELAHRGTIFLDEIGDLPVTTQIMLLRVLQERQFERVGGSETVTVDVRVITATNRDLEALVGDSDFRSDLYYRLNVVAIRVPPLRERVVDIPLLADHFVERYARANNKQIHRIATSAIDMLTAYHWPGNVRELENCIERAVLLSDDHVIHAHDLPPSLQTAEQTGTMASDGLLATLERVERDLIVDALKNSRGNMAQAARVLKISERVIGLRVKKYRIDPRRFRSNT